ncbi:hypothetical protein NFI96_006716 [Prochilodus magdalenae]|nr:hypothetical protein NFI96_006716 [Prochilodus magdalenae]
MKLVFLSPGPKGSLPCTWALPLLPAHLIQLISSITSPSELQGVVHSNVQGSEHPGPGRAVEELLKEANRARVRAETMGPAGWMKCPLGSTNKRFLLNTLRSSALERRSGGQAATGRRGEERRSEKDRRYHINTSNSSNCNIKNEIWPFPRLKDPYGSQPELDSLNAAFTFWQYVPDGKLGDLFKGATVDKSTVPTDVGGDCRCSLASHGQTDVFVKAIDLNMAGPVQLLVNRGASLEGKKLQSAFCVNSDTNGQVKQGHMVPVDTPVRP